jgi:hypothetical protein
VRAAVLEDATAAKSTLARNAPAYVTRSRRLRERGVLVGLTGTADRGHRSEHLTALILGDKDLIVTTHRERPVTAVLATHLKDMQIGSQLRSPLWGPAATSVTATGFPVTVEA